MIPLSRCVIITSYQSALLRESFDFRKDDYIICADGGYSHAREQDITPNDVIGDFDSMDFSMIEKDLPVNSSCGIIRVAAEKDDTDSMICLKHGMNKGFTEFFIIGGLGGRLDHTIANLQTMSYAVDHQHTIWFLDGKNKATLRNPGKTTIQKQEGFKISLFTFGDSCDGVSIQGVKYPLESCLLNNSFPLGVSNEFIEETAEIRHTSGKLLIILSQD